MLSGEKKKNLLGADSMKAPAKPGKKPAGGATRKGKAAEVENNRLFFKPGKANATNQDQAAREKAAKGEAFDQKDENLPYNQVQAILKKHNIPGVVLPTNIKDYEYKPSNGALKIILTNGFMKEITDATGKTHEIKFDQVLEMKLEGTRLNSIRGITIPTSHSARLTDIVVQGNGYLRLTGRVGFFSKSLELKQTDFPPLP